MINQVNDASALALKQISFDKAFSESVSGEAAPEIGFIKSSNLQDMAADLQKIIDNNHRNMTVTAYHAMVSYLEKPTTAVAKSGKDVARSSNISGGGIKSESMGQKPFFDSLIETKRTGNLNFFK